MPTTLAFHRAVGPATRRLIELGGPVIKAGLIDLTDDDRATLYGALVSVAERLRSYERKNILALWQRKGTPDISVFASANKIYALSYWLLS